MNKAEILAPAGSPEQLVAAVRAGADAVYLGAGSMNARRSAKNFSAAELKEACAFCRERGVKVYLTLNTLVFDDELAELEQVILSAAEAGVDAMIVQDLGAARCVRSLLPEMPLHASTQMTLHTPLGVEAAAKLGFSRAILSRELSLEEIKEISKTAKRCNIELECFVHGALCMSVSGQCYLSSVLGARSGNRGRCAQPCRLAFSAGEREMCLSLKDMSHIGHIKELCEAGIVSLKIEGRMKRPEYCAAAVTAVRCARDSIPAPEGLEEKLAKVFSRQGFTDGYLTAKRGEPMFGFRTKDDVIAGDSKLMASLHNLTRAEFARVPIAFELEARKGEPVSLRVCDDIGNAAEVFGDAALPSEKDCDVSAVEARLCKTGGTAYIAKARCSIEKGLYLPASAVNSLKRSALEQLSEKRRAARPAARGAMPLPPEQSEQRDMGLSCIFADAKMLPESFPENTKRVFLPAESDISALEAAKNKLENKNIELCLELPRGCFGNEAKLAEKLGDAKKLGINKIMAHNLGSVLLVKNAGLEPIGGFGLNITNSHALEAYRSLGVEEAELSFETTLARAVKLGSGVKKGLLIYGRLPLMLTRNCPAALSGGCQKGKNCSIKDRYDIEFPVRCRNGCSEVFNSIPMSIVDKIAENRAVSGFFARFTVENSVEIEEIFEIITAAAKGNTPRSNKNFTRGLAFRSVE